MSFWNHKRKVIENSNFLSAEEKAWAITLTHILEELAPHPNSLYFTAKNEMVFRWAFDFKGKPYEILLTFPPKEFRGEVMVNKLSHVVES
jgi:hypothetical protein